MDKFLKIIRRYANVTILSVAFLSFSSCTLVELGYRYADWLIKRRIMEVVKFYSPQQDRLEKILDDYMAWHRKTMMPQYKREVDRVILRVESLKNANKSITSEEVHEFLIKTRELYLDSFIPLAHRVSPLLSELGEEQVDRTQTLINRKMERLKQRSELSKSDYRQEVKDTWADNLEDWFGDLTKEQLELLEKNIDSILSSPKASFARGGRRTQEFLAIFEELPLPNENQKKSQVITETYAKREAKLKSYFNNWSDKTPYDQWRKNVSSFMAAFFSILKEEQKVHFLKKLKGWQESLEELIEVQS